MSRPWMPWYVAEFVADTMHLNAAQSGSYMLLIGHYWMHGALPTDDTALARIARMTAGEWRKNRPVIEAFFHDGWRHKRIDAELAKAADISSKRSASAKQKLSNCSANAPPNAEQLDTHARAGLPSPSQREEVPADAGTPAKSYAFESGVIRLTQKDFDKWKQAFSHLDLAAELISLANWASTERSWFNAVSGALAKRNREIGLRKEQQASTPEFKWKSGIEGVI